MTEPYIPLIHLATAISISGGEMLEKMGSMRACHWLRNPGMEASCFADLEKAVEKASRAVALYKLAIASGQETFTDAEWAALLNQTAQVADLWQPIETAPRDGTNILACVAGVERSQGEAFWWEGGWRTWDGENHRRTVMYPTHWQPLPAPAPVDARSEEAA